MASDCLLIMWMIWSCRWLVSLREDWREDICEWSKRPKIVPPAMRPVIREATYPKKRLTRDKEVVEEAPEVRFLRFLPWWPGFNEDKFWCVLFSRMASMWLCEGGLLLVSGLNPSGLPEDCSTTEDGMKLASGSFLVKLEGRIYRCFCRSYWEACILHQWGQRKRQRGDRRKMRGFVQWLSADTIG